MRCKPWIVLAGALAVGGAAADGGVADSPPPPLTPPSAPTGFTVGPVRFGHIDANGDGWLTPDELDARSPLVEHWDEADVDGDGRLSAAEFAAFEGRAAEEE